MDGTLVNVNGQIVCWNEFHPSFPALGQVVVMFVVGDCITNCLCIFPISWEQYGLSKQTFLIVIHGGAFQVWL